MVVISIHRLIALGPIIHSLQNRAISRNRPVVLSSVNGDGKNSNCLRTDSNQYSGLETWLPCTYIYSRNRPVVFLDSTVNSLATGLFREYIYDRYGHFYTWIQTKLSRPWTVKTSLLCTYIYSRNRPVVFFDSYGNSLVTGLFREYIYSAATEKKCFSLTSKLKTPRKRVCFWG